MKYLTQNRTLMGNEEEDKEVGEYNKMVGSHLIFDAHNI